MKKNHTILGGLAAVALVLLPLGCSSAAPTETPGVDQMGTYVRRHTGPELDAVLGYRYAATHPGEEWLILELAVSSPNGASAEIERGKVFVRTPSGETIPLATQKEFSEAYGGLRGEIRKANIMRDPLGYFPANRVGCDLAFFAAPGGGVVFNTASVDDRRVCFGKLFFYVPGGVQPGRWVLGIDLEESSVRLPFQL